MIGGGFIGMETTASLRRRGLAVTQVDLADELYASLQAPPLSGSLERLYRERGVEVILGDIVAEFRGSGGKLTGAVTQARARDRAPSSRSSASACSPRPAISRAPASSSRRARCSSTSASRRSVPGIYAVGDIANFCDPIFGHRRLIQHWTNANHQGDRLGRLLAGQDTPYDQVAFFFSEVFGTKIGLLGDLDGGHDELVMRGSLEEGALIGWYLRDERLVAALIVGQTPETAERAQRAAAAHGRAWSTGRRSPIPTHPPRSAFDTGRMSVEIRRVGPGDEGLFEHIADDVFDHAVERDVLAEYLATPGHHFVVALAGGEVVGQVAAVLHRHADLRPVELYIDEVAVAPAFRRQGVAQRMLDEMFALGRALGCAEAWVGTEARQPPRDGPLRVAPGLARAVRHVRLRALGDVTERDRPGQDAVGDLLRARARPGARLQLAGTDRLPAVAAVQPRVRVVAAGNVHLDARRSSLRDGVVVAPAQQGGQDRADSLALGRRHVLVGLAAVARRPALEQSVLDQLLEAVTEDVRRDAEIALDLREAAAPEQDLAHDEQRTSARRRWRGHWRSSSSAR